MKTEAMITTTKERTMDGTTGTDALAKVERAQMVAGWSPPVWDQERIALAKRAVTPPSATDAEFAFFVGWCKRTGLDPFIGQAYLVERKSKAPGGGWDVKHQPMAAEAGMAAIADGQPDFRGIRCGTVWAGDVFGIDEMEQTVLHRWSLEDRAKAGNRVLGAWAHALRAGRVVPISWVTLESRIQVKQDWETKKIVPTQFWARDPGGMLLKCARALAWRSAFPNLFSGVMIQEEVREDVEEAPAPPPPATGESKTDRLAARLGLGAGKPAPASPPPTAKPAAAAPPPVRNGQPLEAQAPVEDAPFTPAPAEAQTEKALKKAKAPKKDPAPAGEFPVGPTPPPAQPATQAAAPAAKAPTVLPVDVVRFGKAKGQPIADASTVDLEEAVDVAIANLAKAKGQEGWIPSVREGLAAIEAELDRRNAAMDAAPSPEAEAPAEE